MPGMCLNAGHTARCILLEDTPARSGVPRWMAIMADSERPFELLPRKTDCAARNHWLASDLCERIWWELKRKCHVDGERFQT